MSFWKQSPGPHWSHFAEGLVALEGRPYVLRKELPLQPTFAYDLVAVEDCDEIAQLLKAHYQTYPGSRVSLTADQIKECLDEGWIGIMIRGLGVVFSRPLGTLAFGETIMREQAGLVDFFCVTTQFRQKGMGSRLLTALFYETSKAGRHVHLFQKEGFPLMGLPPLWTSVYCWRSSDHVHHPRVKRIEPGRVQLPLGSPCWNTTAVVKHTDVYEYDGTYVGITDIFHTSVPSGGSIGEVSWISGKRSGAALEAIVDSCTYDILLMDFALPHDEGRWKKDARYTYYIFNAQPMRFLDVQPALTF